MAQKQAFTAGIVLLVAVRGSKQARVPAESLKRMDDARKCLNYIVACEPRYDVLRRRLVPLSHLDFRRVYHAGRYA